MNCCDDEIPPTFAHKRGDTFDFDGTYTEDDGTPINLTGITVSSQVRTPAGVLVSTAVVTKANQTTNPGEYSGVIANTAAWPVQKLEWDVQYVGGPTDSTETVYLQVQRDVTQ